MGKVESKWDDEEPAGLQKMRKGTRRGVNKKRNETIIVYRRPITRTSIKTLTLLSLIVIDLCFNKMQTYDDSDLSPGD